MKQDPVNFWMQMERLERLIRAAELKAGLIFSFHSLILGLFFDRLDALQDTFQNSIIFIILVSLWILFGSISIYYSIKCFIPRIELKYKKNVFFFKDAINSFGTIEEFSKQYMDVCKNEKELFKYLSQQIHIESKIIDAKFGCVQKSIKFLAVTFVFVVLILVYWLLLL